jgi:UDP-N-acetylglucosamine 2-epimerase (non-hydrolysing)
MKRVAIVTGTRPEGIKMAPVYFELAKSEKLFPVLLSTGQHRQMLDKTLAVFGITPDHDLNLMQSEQTLASLTSAVIDSVANWLAGERIDAVLVQGDTTTAMSSALAAFYADLPIGHVEAGLRTGNMRAPWPEEMNRRLTSPLARWNFCPTPLSRENLIREGISEETCHVTGNTVIDALLWMREKLLSGNVGPGVVAERVGIPQDFTLRFLANPAARWVLVTGHRRESFGQGFARICEAIVRLVEENADLGVLYPVHLNPQVQNPVRSALGSNPRIALVEPAAYEDFIWLMDHATFLLTDSGGVQEEAPSLGKPVLVMRDVTERPEGIEAGTCRLVGTDPSAILAEARVLLHDANEYARRSRLKNPYGDGMAAARIRRVLETDL